MCIHGRVYEHPIALSCAVMRARSWGKAREHVNPYTRIGINIEGTQGRQRQRQQQRPAKQTKERKG